MCAGNSRFAFSGIPVNVFQGLAGEGALGPRRAVVFGFKDKPARFDPVPFDDSPALLLLLPPFFFRIIPEFIFAYTGSTEKAHERIGHLVIDNASDHEKPAWNASGDFAPGPFPARRFDSISQITFFTVIPYRIQPLITESDSIAILCDADTRNAEMGTAACFEYLCFLKKHIISISTIICPTNPHILTEPVRTSLAKRFWRPDIQAETAIPVPFSSLSALAFQPGLCLQFFHALCYTVKALHTRGDCALVPNGGRTG